MKATGFRKFILFACTALLLTSCDSEYTGYIPTDIPEESRVVAYESFTDPQIVFVFREQPNANAKEIDKWRLDKKDFFNFYVTSTADANWIEGLKPDYSGEQVRHIKCYVDRASFDKGANTDLYWKAETDKPVFLRESPNFNADIVDTLTYHDYRKGKGLNSVPLHVLVGDFNKPWITLGESYFENGSYTKYRIVLRYIDKKSFDEFFTVEYKDINKELSESNKWFEKYQKEEKLHQQLNSSDMHLWIMWLTLFYFACAFLGKGRDNILLFGIEYLTLMTAFVMELIYFGFLENDFEWCNWDRLGILKALGGFIVSAIIIWIQFKGYFNLIRQIKLFSRPFNSYIGTLLLGAFLLVIFIIGGLSGADMDDWWVSAVVIAALVIQEIIIIVKLRHNPVIMVAALLFLPIGICGFLLTFFKFLGFAIIVAIIGIIFYGIGQGSGSSAGSQGSSSGGNWGGAKNCPHFDEASMMCNRGHKQECGLNNSGRCQHGQM
ncbi:hypothetical protein [Viscerimonas tarda]